MPKQSQRNSDSDSDSNNNSNSNEDGANASASPSQPTVLTDLSTFDYKRLGFIALKPTANAKQNVCLPKYLFDTSIEPTKDAIKKKGTNFYVKVAEIKMSKGGIYPYNEEYHGKERNCKRRAQFKIAKDENDKTSVEFFNLCEKIDKYMMEEVNKNKNKNELLCTINDKKEEKKCKGLTYKPMVQTNKPKKNVDADSDDDEDPKSEPYNYVNVKLSKPKEYSSTKDTDYIEIDTQVFLQENETAEKVKTVTDMEKYLKWNCKAIFILHFFKVWMQNSGDYECSFGIKCTQMCITEQAADSSNSSFTNSQLFSKNIFATKGPKAVSAAASKKDASDNDDNEDNDKDDKNKSDDDNEKQEKQESEKDDESEPEKAPTPPPVKNKKGTRANNKRG